MGASFQIMIKKIITSFTFFIAMGMLAGFLTGGIPWFSEEISTISIMIAITFSLTPIDIKKVRIKKKHIIYPLLINYGFLTSITILIGLLFPSSFFPGFVIIAAVPPAVAIIPLTKILKADVEFSLIAVTFLYLLSLVLTPLLLFLFFGEGINVQGMIQTIILMILLPLLLSQIIRWVYIPGEKTSVITNLCFFFVMVILVGKNRMFLIQEIEIISLIAVASFLRTFGTGYFIKLVTSKLGFSSDEQVPLMLFGVIKNEGYAMILALSLFGGVTVIPAVLALLFEMFFIGCLESKICTFFLH